MPKTYIAIFTQHSSLSFDLFAVATRSDQAFPVTKTSDSLSNFWMIADP